MNIKTAFVYPPIPTREFDWQAWDEDTYEGPESKSLVGFGSTEAAAIQDLKDQMGERK